MLYSYEKFLTELGRKLRALRIDRGLTLRAMILEHGFHLAQWQGFEKGRGISVPTLLRLCEIFDLKLEELIGGIGVASRPEDTSAAEAVAAEPACLPAGPRKPHKKATNSPPSPISPAPLPRRPKR